MRHTPVLLKQVIEVFSPQKGEKYIDATFGMGGHASEIAKSGASVLALDWDESIVKKFKGEAQAKGVKLVSGNYADIYNIAKENKFVPCKGILFDLGLSMEQIGEGKRGFSYKEISDPVDMRLSEEIEISALDIVKSYSEDELYEILVQGSEELNSRAIVQSIVRTRRLKKIKTVGDLNSAIEKGVSFKGGELEKVFRRVYQALFIAVNHEFENIYAGLTGASKCLEGDGKIVVISFHPGHERVVKRYAKSERMSMKVVRAKGERVASFERGATLRILKKI